MAEAAQHQALMAWFRQKGPLAELGLCTLFPQYHWSFNLRWLHFTHHPVLGLATTGQLVNTSDKV